jgi:DNA-binding IclR family transcriptional regulator
MAVAGIARQDEDSKRYSLGLLLYHWGSKAAMAYLPSTLIRHEMILLAREAGHPAFYAVLDNDAVVVLERTQEVSGATVVVPYTTHYHWPASTTGVVLAAFAPPAERQRLLDLEEHLDRESIWPDSELAEVLDQVMHQGYAERTLSPGRTTLAAPLLDYSGYAVAALGLAVSGYSAADQERLPQLLKAAAAHCSGFLGHVAALAAP